MKRCSSNSLLTKLALRLRPKKRRLSDSKRVSCLSHKGCRYRSRKESIK